MAKIVVINGHPDASRERLCSALAVAYTEGAIEAGHSVDLIQVSELDFPLLRTAEDFNRGAEGTPDALKPAQASLLDANHLVLIYPLWMGTMPALLKAFIEQVFRPGVALSYEDGFPKALLKNKSARVVITMGMPALAYRWYFFAHSLKSLERNILGLVGIKPIRSTIYGMVEQANEGKRHSWLDEMRALGKRAA